MESPAISRIEGVLFDLDGTLIDTYELIMDSMRYTMRTVLMREFPDEELGAGIGTPLRDQMVHFAQGDQQLADTLTSVYRAYNEARHDEVVRAFEGVADMLAELRQRGIAVAVVTSKRHELAEQGLRVSGILEHLSFIIGPDDFPLHKPHPGPVLEGCRRMGLASERCLYVGDSAYDLRAGNAAGCETVAVSWGMFPLQQLLQENPTYVVDRPGQLIDLVAGEQSAADSLRAQVRA